MAREKTQYVCGQCGANHARMVGKCHFCNGWNTVTEEVISTHAAKAESGASARVDFLSLEDEAGATTPQVQRIVTGIGEFDRVLGGGLVPGSVTLLSGDPGVGKSTLLLQVAAATARAGADTVYLSGEEAAEQIRLRALRLGLEGAPLSCAATTSLSPALASMERDRSARLLVVDSIQTMHLDTLESAPGSVSQVRESANALVRLAKTRGIAVLIVGHVTKDGTVAGPKVLEHLVDTVLQFEGERGGHFRILRAWKNRFGAADEIGVWEMTGDGLSEVTNPSALFLGSQKESVAGTAVFAGLEGSRPLLVEIQALMAPAPYGSPRRAVVGWDGNRLAQILAVLETRCGVIFSQQDVYLNVAGGLRIAEPAADLAVAAALLSAAEDTPLPLDLVMFGEIALSGEVRGVANHEIRMREAKRLGFCQVWHPGNERRGQEKVKSKVKGKGKDMPSALNLVCTELERVQDLPKKIMQSKAESGKQVRADSAERESAERESAERNSAERVGKKEKVL